ncbi:hypothetical protein JAAARDRAFT_120264 [Jaapia argillacea MUCL 33604]|uniref:SYO1-like TPR repeats domain-containing protein n=1 Tax=Jaapia argillacea MUCL 33604 TaxID=933084 RepID=A0A067QKI1_9AGAM|nr:hypothetical protein JAAARDRAFT_120264 [Jaapia argillacea MUCL 33604]
MGKSQKKRSMRRHNPMRVPDSHLPKGLNAASSSSSKTEAILPILQKMESLDASERKWACVAVSNLIQNDPSTRRLLQGKNVVGALITRLTDSEEEVVVEAAGALRNLCIDGGYDICGEMFNKNILAPLMTFPAKISGVLSQYLESPKSSPENARKLIYEFADSVITILWCLSETSHKALNAINQISLVPFLMSFLASRDKLPVSTVTSAAQCLYILTEDNPPAISQMRSNSAYAECLYSIIRSTPTMEEQKSEGLGMERAVTLRLLACGILRNAPPPSSTPSPVDDLEKEILLPLIEPVVASVSLAEASTAVQTLIERIASEPQIEKLSLKNTPKSDHKSTEEMELERIETKLRTVQLGLEMLTGICATLPEPEIPLEDESDEDDDDMEDAGDDDMEADDTIPGVKPNPSSPSFLPSLVQPLLALIQPTPLSFPPFTGPSPHPPTTSVISAIHICALECLNNIFLSLASSPNPVLSGDKEGGARVWDEVWKALAAVGLETGPGQERRREMWEIGVGVLWGIAIIWRGSLVPQENHVKLLMQLSDVTSDQTVRVRCIGALECLAQHPESIDANRVISTYLLSMLPIDANPSAAGIEPTIQAASALIDIYSDEGMPYDVNFRQEGYIDRLAQSVEGFRKTIKGIDRKKEGGKELRLRGEEVRDNLVAFIKYRRQLRL